MPIISLDIQGYRGFATSQRLQPAVPNGKVGSGLTLLVGANNTGKSTVVEACRFFAANSAPSFTEGRRNKLANDRVTLALHTQSGQVWEIKTVAEGGSETTRTQTAGPQNQRMRIFGLPSRRHFSAYGGGRGVWTRDNFADNTHALPRGERLDGFFYRLHGISKNRAPFDAMLGRVLDPVPAWTLEQSDQGGYYVKLAAGKAFHNAEGAGEGFVSLLFLVDALYDSEEGDTIIIDEPELSLHASLQRRLATLISDVARTRQVICATHSPYFITPEGLLGGATIARTYLVDHNSRVAHLQHATAQALVRFANDMNNPHAFGLDAREVFFLNDSVILVEGQEDVVAYQRISSLLNRPFNGSFFGWGVGGADKMPAITRVLHELGFQKVVGILDANKAGVLATLRNDFPAYRFFAIPTDDVRTKPAVPERRAKVGVLNEQGGVSRLLKNSLNDGRDKMSERERR